MATRLWEGASSTEPPDILSSLTFVLTAQCNLRCAYCYQTAQKGRAIDPSTIVAAIQGALSLAKQNLRLVFTGGEPLLAWETIRRTVEYAASLSHRTRIRYEINTNGLLLTDEILGFLDEHDFHVQLSFDGVAASQNYRGRGSFDTLDAVLRRLRYNALFRRLRVSAIQMPATVQYLSESVRYLLESGVRDLILFPAMRAWPEWRHENIELLDQQFAGVYADSLRVLERTGTVPVRLFRKQNDVDNETEPCSARTGTNVVMDVNGQAYGCVLFAESYQELRSELLKKTVAPLRLGDFRSKDFPRRHEQYLKKIAEAPLFRDLDERYSSYGRCTECPYRRSCSVCSVAIACDPANTDPHRVPDFICAYNRVALKYRAMFPCLPDPLELLRPARQEG